MVLECPAGTVSFAEMVRKVNTAVYDEKLSYDITTRRAKSGNIIFEISEKNHANNQAEVLRARLGDTIGIKRPSPGVSLLLVGIEDSVEVAELRKVLEDFDTELQGVIDFTIREGKMV